MPHRLSLIITIFLLSLINVETRRNLYETKCTRSCSVATGNFDCWKQTTDGFTFGLATAMVDFCQAIINLRQNNNDASWHEKIEGMLNKAIENYEIDEVKQLDKDAVRNVSKIFLTACFYENSTILSMQPPCPFCTDDQNRKTTAWRISSIALISVAGVFAFFSLVSYALYVFFISRSQVFK